MCLLHRLSSHTPATSSEQGPLVRLGGGCSASGPSLLVGCCGGASVSCQTLGTPLPTRVFIPKYTQQLQLELQGCTSNQSGGCPVRLSVGSATSPGSFQKMLSCAGPNPSCQLLLASPPWDQWLHVMAESLAGPRASVAFSAVAVLTGGLSWGWEPGSAPDPRLSPLFPQPAGPGLCPFHHWCRTP